MHEAMDFRSTTRPLPNVCLLGATEVQNAGGRGLPSLGQSSWRRLESEVQGPGWPVVAPPPPGACRCRCRRRRPATHLPGASQVHYSRCVIKRALKQKSSESGISNAVRHMMYVVDVHGTAAWRGPAQGSSCLHSRRKLINALRRALVRAGLGCVAVGGGSAGEAAWWAALAGPTQQLVCIQAKPSSDDQTKDDGIGGDSPGAHIIHVDDAPAGPGEGPECLCHLCTAAACWSGSHHRGLPQAICAPVAHSLVDICHRNHGSCPAHPVVHRLPILAQPGARVRPAGTVTPDIRRMPLGSSAGAALLTLLWQPDAVPTAARCGQRCRGLRFRLRRRLALCRAAPHLRTRAKSWKKPMDMAEMPRRRCTVYVDTLVPVACCTATKIRMKPARAHDIPSTWMALQGRWWQRGVGAMGLHLLSVGCHPCLPTC